MATDLYRNRATGPLLKNPLWQRLAQWTLAAGLIALALGGLGREKLPGVTDPWPLIYTHGATLLFWVVWFMGVVLAAPLIGRAWCGVCPLGFINERVGRLGLNRPWPRGALRWVGIIAVFAAGVGAALFFDVHKSPHRTALVVLASTGLAVVSGLIWRRASFCKLFCPVGLVLSVYGRFAPLKVATFDPSLCESCTDRGCTAARSSLRRWDIGSLVMHRKVYSSGCPVALNPPTMEASQCLLCLECVRGCSRENLGLFWGKRCSTAPLTTPAVTMLVLLAGLVVLALIRTWPALAGALTPGAYPTTLGSALWLGLALPTLLILGPVVAGHLGRLLSGVEVASADAPKQKDEGGFWHKAGLLAAPLVGPVMGAHLALALVKLNAKAAYVPYLFYDPFGASTYMAIHVADTLELPDMVLSMGVLRVAALTLLALGVVRGLADARRFWTKPLNLSGRVAASLCFAALTALYGATLYHWLFAGRG